MRTLNRSALLLLLLTSFAHANESTIPCPDIDTLHQSASAISDVAFVNGSYIAATLPFAIHTTELGWFAVVYHINANSSAAALEQAKQAMLTVATQVNKFADNLGGIYTCHYDNGKVETISNDDDWR